MSGVFRTIKELGPLLAVIAFTYLFCGFYAAKQGKVESGDYTVITEGKDGSIDYKIVHMNDTKVKYVILEKKFGASMNELYNPDGTLAVYKAETEIEEQKKNSASNSYCVSEYHGRVYQP